MLNILDLDFGRKLKNMQKNDLRLLQLMFYLRFYQDLLNNHFEVIENGISRYYRL